MARSNESKKPYKFVRMVDASLFVSHCTDLWFCFFIHKLKNRLSKQQEYMYMIYKASLHKHSFPEHNPKKNPCSSRVQLRILLLEYTSFYTSLIWLCSLGSWKKQECIKSAPFIHILKVVLYCLIYEFVVQLFRLFYE